MILKGFKEKSNQNYINKTLNNRVVNSSDSKIKSVGVIINIDEMIDYKWFDSLFKTLKIESSNCEIIAFTKEKTIEENNFFNSFNKNSIGWKGNIKNESLKSFLSKEYDILISYYLEASMHLKLLTVKSKANFKVGILHEDERLNDLIIKTPVKAYNTFEKELLKYLTILNKI
ncbi:hypothetical protein [Lacinutrix sp. 5H-3-7-4]|uniref:DUF6913 domain-containing protein n=1 Tax=Lacinutrix sp. (strain 5H-3-7-4) TaxID=983544 RepID=UPI00020A3CB5|nr:hypothetical protein [Lacinutrix sp. 5H-3-7-4]AEH02805.1 hypothetical protein Lacal_2967 [Lacinutrix sp. 5H-3-7-4]